MDPGSATAIVSLGRWFDSHLQQEVVLDIDWYPVSDNTFHPSRSTDGDHSSSMVSAVPDCFQAPAACSGGMELYLENVNVVPDASFTGVGATWNLTGTFLVQSVDIGTGGFYIVHLRAVNGN